MTIYKFADLLWKAKIKNEAIKKMFEPFKEQTDRFDVVLESERQDELASLLKNASYALIKKYDGLMLHSAAIVYKNKAYLFVAPSGTGKTTHVMLWKKMLGDKVFILNGDKPFIRNIGGKAYAFGGPFKGKEGFGQSGKYEIGGIYLLRRGNQNRIEDADSKEKLKALVGSTFMYEDISIRLKILEILQKKCVMR